MNMLNGDFDKIGEAALITVEGSDLPIGDLITSNQYIHLFQLTQSLAQSAKRLFEAAKKVKESMEAPGTIMLASEISAKSNSHTTFINMASQLAIYVIGCAFALKLEYQRNHNGSNLEKTEYKLNWAKDLAGNLRINFDEFVEDWNSIFANFGGKEFGDGLLSDFLTGLYYLNERKEGQDA